MPPPNPPPPPQIALQPGTVSLNVETRVELIFTKPEDVLEDGHYVAFVPAATSDTADAAMPCADAAPVFSRVPLLHLSGGSVPVLATTLSPLILCISLKRWPLLPRDFIPIAQPLFVTHNPPPSLPPAPPVPSLPPPPPSPFPPAPPGDHQYSVSFIAIISGTVEAFDRDAFASSLAFHLGVTSVIDLTVAPSSIRVSAAISSTSHKEMVKMVRAIDALSADPAAASAALGVQIESLSVAQWTSTPLGSPLLPPPSPPLPSPPPSPPIEPLAKGTAANQLADDSGIMGVVTGATIGGIALLTAILSVLGILLWRSLKARRGPHDTDAVQVQVNDMDITSMTSTITVIGGAPATAVQSMRADRVLVDVFISFRFGEAHAEALALKAALEARGVVVFLSDAQAGADLQQLIAHAISTCRLAVILGSPTYGRRTNGLFCTWSEMNYIIGHSKPYYLVRMVPFDSDWAEVHTSMAFPPSIMQKLWMLGDPMPTEIVDEVVQRLRA